MRGFDGCYSKLLVGRSGVFFSRDADESGGQRWQAAQNRRRGPSVLERLRADEETAVQVVAAASERWAKWRKTAAIELRLGCTGALSRAWYRPAKYNRHKPQKAEGFDRRRFTTQNTREARDEVASGAAAEERKEARRARRSGERGGEASE